MYDEEEIVDKKKENFIKGINKQKMNKFEMDELFLE